jgi:FlaA1/EpsC-like NDP-sugar epimerase
MSEGAMNAMYDFVFRRIHQVLLDLGVFAVCWFAAYVVRFEGLPAGIYASYLKQMLILMPIIMMARLISFYVFSVYNIVWRYISIRDTFFVLAAMTPVTIVLAGLRYLTPIDLPLLRVPISVIVIEFLLVLLGSSGIRIARRLAFEVQMRDSFANKNGDHLKSVLLIGAGDAGDMVLRELQQRADLGVRIVGFLDDDPKKYGKTIHGVRVLGNTTQIPEFVAKNSIQEAIISIVNASSRDIRRIMDACTSSGIKAKIIPGIFELLEDSVKVSKVRDIRIEDLLGRDVVNFEARLPEIEGFYRDKRIMVTGAGGSIGSELCRQLCLLWPKDIILLDKDENSIYEIDTELQQKHPECQPVPIIANIKNRQRLDQIFAKWHPDVVFHAAAHKHVPLMEINASEAILNNVVGSLNTIEGANASGVERFIFISSDKAVNPTNIMGATKRVGEVLVQDVAARSRTKFSCVRFGNVLGSRGSVVPLFQRQIAGGGPVTVTHPDAERYFMSISEAVQLIIQAGTMGDRGEIFILDMGKPVKIKDLAMDLIRLSGFQDGEIEVKYTGMRTGEKLYEEILIDKERDGATRFEKIFMAAPFEFDYDAFRRRLGELVGAAGEGDVARIRAGFREMGIGFNGVGR